LETHVAVYMGREGSDAITFAVEYWDEGFWAAPGDWVVVPNRLRLEGPGGPGGRRGRV
jgi:hypothetical protein